MRCRDCSADIQTELLHTVHCVQALNGDNTSLSRLVTPHLAVTPLYYRPMSIVFYQFEASSIIDIDSFRDKQRYTIDRRMAFVALASACHL